MQQQAKNQVQSKKIQLVHNFEIWNKLDLEKLKFQVLINRRQQDK
jgi:hypothetical protein